MLVHKGTTSEHAISEPLDLLINSHRRMNEVLDQLTFVHRRAGSRQLNAVEREMVAEGLRYTRRFVPLHKADEEVSLFPRMREASDPQN